jgi:hypothetical protein
VNICRRLIVNQAVRRLCQSDTQQALQKLELSPMEWNILEDLEMILQVSDVNMPEIHDDSFISGATLRSANHVG